MQPATVRGELIVVQGAAGDDTYAQVFADSATAWRKLAEQASLNLHSIGPGTGAPSDREQLQTLLEQYVTKADGTSDVHAQSPICLVLIGHGTFNLGKAKFNLQGPDLTSEDLLKWLAGITRPVAIVDCSSASAPFLEKLSAANRVIVTATRAGTEQNYARFGEYLARAIGDEATDLDHDGAVSILEAFVRAAHDTEQFYRDESRLATEHALLDDNGDQAGTPADFFRGIRAVGKASDGRSVDGLRAHQWLLRTFSEEPVLSDEKLTRRNELETQLEAFR
ncbi:MAG: hypothetical protein KDB23_29540, partial [Planctomycetales bacterium]|nr:hypothetical protein [Planctomycetales bacterium]